MQIEEIAAMQIEEITLHMRVRWDVKMATLAGEVWVRWRLWSM
jgi:hypothetical protein